MLFRSLRVGQGRIAVHPVAETDPAQPAAAQPPQPWRWSTDLHCPDCDLHYTEPTPSAFSFNSPVGACEACRGFGRVIGIDFGLIVPDENKTLAGGAVKPWQTPSFKECQDDLMKYARIRGVATDVPFCHLPPEHRQWVLEGEPEWRSWSKS